MDEGSSVKRPSRQSLLQDLEVEEDVADQKVTSEAVPDSGNKNKREEDEVVDQNLEMDIMESLASGTFIKKTPTNSLFKLIF